MSRTPLQIQRAGVYLLQRLDRLRFKLGWSLAPLSRARKLPEFTELDLSNSFVRWLPTRVRAEQVERAMLKAMAPHRVRVSHHQDGHSEWFLPGAFGTAVQLLSRMPANDTRFNRPVLTLLQSQDDVLEIDNPPQEVWWAVEDLWLRLAALLPMSVHLEQGQLLLVVQAFRLAVCGEVGDLRAAILDSETYTWRQQNERDAFVRLIEFRGDDLVYVLTPLNQMRRWSRGPDLVLQVQGLLAKLRARAGR